MNVITTSTDLAVLCARLASESYITVDTEFMREKTYYPQLCLVQVAGASEAAMIDALAPDLDWSPFWELMRNTSVLKVFHAPRQDIEIFVHLGNVIPQPIFDTQIAAMALGYAEQVSYAKLCETMVDTIIDKQEQFTDWTVRPLREAQLEYALQDVTVLRHVYDAMQIKLIEMGRLTWLDEEMARLNDIGYYRVDPDTAWERLRLRSNKPQSWAALRALAAWREREAMRLDRPRQMILKDDVLSQLAMTVPTTMEHLSRTRGLPNFMLKDSVAPVILEMMTKAKSANASVVPQRDDTAALTPHQEDQLDLLRLALKLVARQQSIAPRLLATQEDLTALIQGKPSHIDTGWRFDLFGNPARALLDGSMGITANGLVMV